FESLPVAIFSSPVNPDYDTTWISGDVKKITGFENDEYVSENDFWRKRLHPEDKERVLNAYKNFPPNGEMILEYRWRCKDGQYHWFYDRAILLENESKQEYLGVIVDITERKQAEETLRQSESNLKKAQRFAHIGSWLWNIKTNELEWSDEMYHIFGVNKETFSGVLSDAIAQSIHPDDRYKVEQSNLSVINEAKPIPVEYRVIWPDGSEHVVWAEAGELILDETGHPSFLSGTVQDITSRKHAEETLRASEERYRELFNSMIDGFALHETICDENGKPVDYRFLEVNPAYERLTGLQAADLIGKTVLEVLPKTESYWMEVYGSVALTGRPAFFENYSGEFGRYFEVSAYRPQPGQIAIIMVDITERKRAEEDIHQRVTDLELLYESGLALSQLLDPKEIGQKILKLLKEKLGWHYAIIRLCHPQDDRLELLAFNQLALKTETERHSIEERLNRPISRSGDGLSGWAMQQSQTIRSGDVRNDPHYIETYPGIRSGLYTPMKLGERMIGVICIESEQPDAFSEADERLITTLANQAASAFENARLFDETHQRVTDLELLYESGLALSQLLNPKEIGQKILELLEEKLGLNHTRIRLYHPQDDRLELLAFNQ
ncbi:MAG: PAS domain-containing protein, partial [Anaerolineales bacterium]|nr:PAS domain-containing protein [Anaerolineales bacterium]